MYIILTQRVISATQARAQFFDLLKMAEDGKEVIIVKRDSSKRFKLTSILEKSKLDKEMIIKEMGEINFPFISPEEIKKIILTKYDDSISGY